MNWKAFAVVAALVTAACAAPAVISDISDSSLKVQANNYTPPGDILAEADRGCALHNKEPVRISERCMDGYCTYKEVLFACK
jgi:hypothetical protein